MKGPIQLLDILIDPVAFAFLTDDGVDGQSPPISGGYWNSSNGVLDPRTGKYVRPGGSGVPPQQAGAKVLPNAVNDTLTVNIGDSATPANVLANDTYSGTPSILILSGPLLDGATAVVTGTGTSSRISYTPPSSGSANLSDEIVYRLRATGNANGSGNLRQRDTATLFVNVVAFNPNLQIGHTYSIQATQYVILGSANYELRVTGSAPGTSILTVRYNSDQNTPIPPLVPPAAPPSAFVVIPDAQDLALYAAIAVADPGGSGILSPPMGYTLTITGNQDASGAFTGTVTVP